MTKETKIKMHVLKKGDGLVFKQCQGGKLIMSGSCRSPYLEPLNLKQDDLIVVTITKA